MPASKSTSTRRPRRVLLTTDDYLFRLICLPEVEQMNILQTFAAAIEKAETTVIAREAALYDAQHRPASVALPA